MLTSVRNCKKDTIFDNLRTITQKRNMKTRLTTSFFSSAFRALTVEGPHFCIWKLSKFIFMGSPFGPFWSAKHLNFRGESCEIRILSCSIQKTYTMKELKNQVLLLLSNWEFQNFQGDLMWVNKELITWSRLPK